MGYKKNFVASVICRIDFPEIPKLKTEEPLDFHGKVKSSFPRYERSIEVKLDTKGLNDVSIKDKTPRWSFLNKEKNKKITISHNHLILELFKYSSFKEFNKLWEMALNYFLGIYKIEFIDRLGLRYINQIVIDKGNPLNWESLINGCLIKNLKCFPELESNIIRSMQKTVYNKDGNKIVFNYGIWNDNFPNLLSKKQFVLDYDCYIDFTLEVAEINNKISEFIGIIYDLFEKSILDKLRKIMGKEE